MTDDEVSRAVALAWGVAASPQRGPKRELTHERIVEAAIQIADDEGLSAVTMQRVAQTFGFTTMAMYRYVATKDDLYRLMLDAAAGDGVVPVDPDDWRGGLEQWSRWLGQVYDRHPWMLDIPLATESLLMPTQMRVADAAMRAMRTLPASPDDKLGLLMLLSIVVRGFAVIRRDIAARDSSPSAGTRALVREVATDGHLPDLEVLVESGAYFGDPQQADAGAAPGAAAEDDLGVGLSTVLAGIQAVYAGQAPPTEHEVPRTPEQQLAAAEAELAAGVALRKRAQRRARDLERRENALRAARDRAKAAAKESARAARAAAKVIRG